MAITYALTVNTSVFRTASPAVSSTLTILNGDVLTVGIMIGDTGPGNLSITNSGTAMTWTSIGIVGPATYKVAAWRAISAHNENRTVTVSWDGATNEAWSLYSIVHTGAHQTTPVPAGNVFTGAAGTDVSQSITPTASGSALWMFAHDRTAANTFAAGTDCTLADTTDGGVLTTIALRPTTQPRTDANAFTLSETDTAGTIDWIAFEVQVAGSQSNAPRAMHHIQMMRG